MTDDREVFKVRREAGLQKRHEKRLESVTYTAAEVRVLTEAALRLGRKEAGEEIAQLHKPLPGNKWCPECSELWPCPTATACMGFRAPGDATNGRTDPGDING